MNSASSFGLSWPISSCALSRRPWNSSGVMGCTRSPSGRKEEKFVAACVSGVAPDGTASVITEPAAVESRKLRREISCGARFSVKAIGKEGWLLTMSDVKKLVRVTRNKNIGASELISRVMGHQG